MTAPRRTSIWPLLIALVGALWLLSTLDVLPEAATDIMQRAWPALLVLFGFDLLVGRRRLRLGQQGVSYAMIALAGTLVGLAALVWLAYAQQADVVRADKQATFAQAVEDTTSQLRVAASMNRTAITIEPTEGDTREVSADYAGSAESDVAFDWTTEGDIAQLTVTEAEQDAIPKLEAYGRGTLGLTLPVAVSLQELTVGGDAGDVSANLRPLRIGQLNLAVGEGDLEVTLPSDAVMTGVLRTGDGDLILNVPQNVALTLSLGEGSGQPTYEYDVARYDLLINGTLKLKNTDAFQVGLTVSLPGGAHLIVNDVE
ncbi:LiaI-LiaF-like domain-containing protein [Aggregatilinea lenta]|uniref:LiaI-LiaF-like domain-containing protein n=1 Tax=Aggregatilinea lenta TaxID=913108 RepID=UPI000E5B8BDA|nr:DUF5668 domain-containing protein [Aggregatilinea lenta]